VSVLFLPHSATKCVNHPDASGTDKDLRAFHRFPSFTKEGQGREIKRAAVEMAMLSCLYIVTCESLAVFQDNAVIYLFRPALYPAAAWTDPSTR